MMKMSEQTTIEFYKYALNNYTMEQLRYKSVEDVWSVGQMYDHLIAVALEYIAHIETCAASSEEQMSGRTEAGEELFQLGGFPPIKIKLPPEYIPRNPESKEEIIAGLDDVQEKLGKWADKVDYINPRCRCNHNGFGWLNAREWYDLVDMHFRHHLRQKAELDQKLV